MLTYEQRVDRYLAQTGRSHTPIGFAYSRLTPRQRRRAMHKIAHQWDVAVERREKRSAARQKAQTAAKQRRVAFLPTASR